MKVTGEYRTMDNTQQPQALFQLFTAEFLQRFSYWGLQSILVIYLTRFFLFPEKDAYVVYGAFTGLTFVASVFGGLISDRLLGFKKSLLIGLVFIIVGNFLCLQTVLNILSLGLALIICGSGLFTPSNANLLGSFYSQTDSRRERGFSIFYMGTNLGGLLGPVCYGILMVKYGWQASFIVSGCALAAWLAYAIIYKKSVIYLSSENEIYPLIDHKKNNKFFVGFCLLFLTVSVWFMLQKLVYVGILLSVIGVMSLIWLFWIVSRNELKQRIAMLILFVMIIFCLLFFSFEFQVNSSLLLFADHYVQKQFFNYTIPTPSIASLEPLFVIVTTPLFVWLWKNLSKRNVEPNAIIKVALGLLFASVGFVILVYAANSINYFAEQKASFIWLLAGCLLLGAGEVCLMPTIIAAITKLSPSNLKGTLMGMLYFALAFSGYFAGKLASSSTDVVSAVSAPTNYAQLYSKIAFLSLISALLALAIGYWVKRKKLNI